MQPSILSDPMDYSAAGSCAHDWMFISSWLWEHGFDPTSDLCKLIRCKIGRMRPLDSRSRTTAMFEAAYAGELAVCVFLWENGAASTIRTTSSFGGWTPMYAACSSGHLDVAMWLFEVGAAEDTRIKNTRGRSPLCAACHGGHLHVAKWLISEGASTDISALDYDLRTPMHEACAHGHLEVASWLFDTGAARDIHTRDKNGMLPMHAACCEGYLDAAKWLFTVGAKEDIRAECRFGSTPMYFACSKGHLNVAKWLAEAGAAEDIHKRSNVSDDVQGWSAVQAAISSGHLEVVKWLFSRGADIRANFTRVGGGISNRSPWISYSSSTELRQWLLLNGAFRGTEGHVAVDAAVALADGDANLSSRLSALLTEHETFLKLILTAVRFGSVHSSKSSTHEGGGLVLTCALSLLRGHEDSVLLLIADLAGILRLRQLRNAREFVLGVGVAVVNV